MNFFIKISFIFSLLILLSMKTMSQPAVKIMPLGNSMTEGWTDGSLPDNQMVGYRKDLKELLTNANYITDFVGSQNNGSFYFGDSQHAGISGSRDNFVARLLQDGYDQRWGVQILVPPRPYLDDFNPDIILLDVGTNDITHENEEFDIDYPDAVANQKISLILDLINQYEARAQKEVIVFLGLIINRRLPCYSGSGCSRTSEFNNAIKAMAQARIAAGDKIVIVDLEHDAGFTYVSGDDMCDTDPQGLHPNATGYYKMASLWFSSISANYNTAPYISGIPDQPVNEGANLVLNLNNFVSDIQDADQYITWTATQLSTNNLNIVIDASRNATISPKESELNATQTVVFTATDRGKNGKYIKSYSDTVIFNITATNDTPVISGQSTLTVTEDNPKALNLSDFTITDPDSPPSSFELKVLPGTNYTLNGSIVTPAKDFSGNLSVNVAVKDNIAQGPTYSALLAVDPVNDPPVYTSQPSIQINEDDSHHVLIQDLNVSDADNTKGELSIVMTPSANYTVIGDIVTPAPNFYGTLQIESYISDPLGAHSATFNLQIVVNPVEDLPLFVSVPPSDIIIDNPYIYTFNAVDPDPEDVLTYTVLQKPDWLSYYAGSRLLAGIPHSSNIGLQQIIIRVNDGSGNVDQSFILDVTTSVITPLSETNMIVYPNPASHELSISGIPLSQDVSFKIYNLYGELVFNKEIVTEDNSLKIDEINIPSGIYLYLIQYNSKIYSGKISIIN